MRSRAGMVAATALALTLVGSAHGAAAGVPRLLTEQGRLFDSMNNPISGATKFVFNLYTVASGGASLWSETQTITLDSGFFSAQLGEVTTLPPAVFETAAASGSTLYLGIDVASDPELSPRQPLLSVPYAMVAGNAVGDITPRSISVAGKPIVDSTGAWVGTASGLQGPAGTAGAQGPAGAQGAAGPAGTMTAGIGPGFQTNGAPLNPGSSSATGFTIVPAVQGFNVGAASTHCNVTITAFYCANPIGVAGMQSVPQPPNAGASVAFGPSGSALSGVAFPCYFPSPSLASGTTANTQCATCSTAYVVGVTAGGSYDFGCDFGLGGSTPNTAGYCQAAVSCY